MEISPQLNYKVCWKAVFRLVGVLYCRFIIQIAKHPIVHTFIPFVQSVLRHKKLSYTNKTWNINHHQISGSYIKHRLQYVFQIIKMSFCSPNWIKPTSKRWNLWLRFARTHTQARLYWWYNMKIRLTKMKYFQRKPPRTCWRGQKAESRHQGVVWQSLALAARLMCRYTKAKFNLEG